MAPGPRKRWTTHNEHSARVSTHRWSSSTGTLLWSGVLFGGAAVMCLSSGTRHSGCEATPGSYVVSQKHLLKPTDQNPTPVRVPPPVSGLSSHLFLERNVASFIGMPLRGKNATAMRLKNYLTFFHGARVESFNVNAYAGRDGSARLLADLVKFFTQDAGRAESGRFAIIFPEDTVSAADSPWSATSKHSRRWMANTLEKEIKANICFIEIKVDPTDELDEYMDRLCYLRGTTREDLKKTMKAYNEIYTTIQDDGTEDDLSYMQLINYNQKVVVNNMMSGFLGSRMAHFLGSVHPYRHTIYLTRHGESQYNAQKKIGGDSSLTPFGREYAHRVAEFADLCVAGGVEKFACVDLSVEELERLGELVCCVSADVGEEGIFATGHWEGVGSGGPVEEGMRLVRVRRGDAEGDEGFQHAPSSKPSLSSLQEMLKECCAATFIFVDEHYREGTATPCRLMTSSLRRTKETAAFIRHPRMRITDNKEWEQFAHRVNRNLDEVYAGEYEGLTYDIIKERNPDEARLRKLDKLGYRYPRGESYYDIIARLDEPLQQVETYREPILIISHQAVLRLVYSYFKQLPREEATEIEVPLHTVIKLSFDGTGAYSEECRYFLGPTRLQTDDGQRHL